MQPKYNLGQIVWYMLDGRIHSAKVLSITTVCNLYNSTATEQQKALFKPWGDDIVKYNTVHTDKYEADVYGSKEELVAALLCEEYEHV